MITLVGRVSWHIFIILSNGFLILWTTNFMMTNAGGTPGNLTHM